MACGRGKHTKRVRIKTGPQKGKVVNRCVSNKSKSRKPKRKGGLKGLTAIAAYNRKCGCLKKNGRLKKGYRFGKGGRCLKARKS